jgi:hypothetical protein
MTESSTFWAGSTTGDKGPYSDDTFSDFICSIMQSDRTTQSVIKGALSELAITNPSGTTIRVASGKALVDGKAYTNTANVDFSISAPATGTYYYTLALRKSFALQTVRLVILGPSASAYPTATQIDGTTWEVIIAKITINSASAIVITDQRAYCSIPTQIQTAQIADDAVTPAKLSVAAFPTLVAGDMLYAIDANTLGVVHKGVAGEAVRMKADGSVPEFGANSDIFIGNRQGGDASVWATGGANNYTPASSKVEVGAALITVTGGVGHVDITLPVSFANAPMVLVGMPYYWEGGLDLSMFVWAYTTGSPATILSIYVNCPIGGDAVLTLPWMLMGSS